MNKMLTISSLTIGVAFTSVAGPVRNTSTTESYQQRYNQSSGSLLTAPDLNMAPPPSVFWAKDPVRQLNGVVYKVSQADPDHGWVEFSGRVGMVMPDGICVNGFMDGVPCPFFVTNFPYAVADGEPIGRDPQHQTCLVAKVVGVHSVVNQYGAVTTLKLLDYGRIYVPPPLTAEQKAAVKAAAQEKLAAAKAKAVAHDQALADKGDPVGLSLMGERYRDGDGVEKDLAKAREYLQKAADANVPGAADELKNLPTTPAQ